MMSVAMAERVASVLEGKVWTGDRGLVRVYFGDSWLSSRDDGTLVMQLGRGVRQTEIEARLLAAGLVTGTIRELSYGGIVIDDARLVALPEESI